MRAQALSPRALTPRTLTPRTLTPRTLKDRAAGAAHRRIHSGGRDSQPWDVISRHQQGLLRYARARGVVSLAVRYTTWGHRLALRLPAHHDAIRFVDRADVALDVDASTVGRVQIARITGVGLAVPTTSLPAEVDAALGSWPDDPLATVAVIAPESIAWLPMVDDLRFPPLPDPLSRLPATFAS